MKPLCDLCGSRHESYQAHVFASNTASNKVTASNNVGIGKASSQKSGEGIEGYLGGQARPRDYRLPQVSGVQGAEERQGNPDVSVGRLARKQRWSREAYNAYQREYMRKRRSEGR